MRSGSPDYMAPEQAMGEADARADVYATAVTIWELSRKKRVDRIEARIARALSATPETPRVPPRRA